MRQLITTDSHIAIPWGVVDGLPQQYRQMLPHLDRRDDGDYLVTPMPPADMAARMAMTGPTEVKIDLDSPEADRIAQGNCCAEAIDPSPLPDRRLEEMAREGVEAAVLIGRSGFGPASADAACELAYTRASNDWLAETFKGHMDRFAPGINVPISDPVAGAAEIERAAAMGLRPALLPDGVPGRPYYLEEWDPIWSTCERLGIPITMHVSGTRIHPSLHPNEADVSARWTGKLEQGFALTNVSHIGAICELVFGIEREDGSTNGVLDRHPDLHVVLTECFAGWMCWTVDFLDWAWSSRYQKLREGRVVRHTARRSDQAPPSFYIKRQISATFMWDPVAVKNRDITGLDCLMWGNDYPHNEGAYPNSQEWVEKQFAGVPEKEIDYIVRGNATRVFGFAV
jgi:predicted TIM-barrel fold metal-dependent hydrolase